jgi:hypothetical protein
MRSLVVMVVALGLAVPVAAFAGGPAAAPSVADPAWSVADYVKAGVPDPDHTWSAQELARAATVIVREAASHPERLPGYRSARSGAVFARLVEVPPDDPAQPIAARVKDGLDRFKALGSLTRPYGLTIHGTPSRDAIELAGAMLRSQAVLMHLTEAFLDSLGSDGRTAARMAGYRRLQGDVAAMATGVLTLVEQAGVAIDDRRAMVQHVAAVLPSTFPHFIPEHQRAARDQIAALVNATTGPLHDDLVAVQRALPAP